MPNKSKRNAPWLAIVSSIMIAGCGGSSSGENQTQPLIPDEDTTSPEPENPVTQNTAPIADAGGTVIGASNSPVFVSGVRSRDVDDDQLTFQWKVIGAPDGSAYTLSSQDSPLVIFESDLEGEYTLELRVSDGSEESVSETRVFVDQDGDGIVADQDLDGDGDFVLDADDPFPSDGSEIYDSNTDGTGNFAEKNEDGDGRPDKTDGFPFDAGKEVPSVFVESQFNDSITVAEETGAAVPLKIGGIIEVENDIDLYKFEVTKEQIVTAACTSDSSSFTPSISFMDSEGNVISTAVTSVHGSHLASAASFVPSAVGTYALIVNNSDFKGDPSFEYGCDLFYDQDTDALSDEIEVAQGVNATRPDSDGDGVLDVAEFLTATANGLDEHDVDGDGVPNWLDRDSDGDFLPDALEGTADPDKDGLPNFADSDSDNNGIGDLADAGPNPKAPIDTDLDGKPNYADIDDDGDGVLDANDAEPLKQVTQSNFLDATQGVRITDVYTEIEEGIEVGGIAMGGQNLILDGTGFGSSPADQTIIFVSENDVANVVPESLIDGKLHVPYPFVTDSEVYVLSGGKKSNGLPVVFGDSRAPYVDRNLSLSGEVYDDLTVRGVNLENVTPSLNGVEPFSWNTVGSELVIGIPSVWADAGDLVITNDYGRSRPISYTEVGETIIYTTLPSGSQLDITTDFLMVSPRSVLSDGLSSSSNRVVLPEGEVNPVYLMLKDANGEGLGVYMQALVPGGTFSYRIDAESTAVSLAIENAAGLSKVTPESHSYLINGPTDRLTQVQNLRDLISTLLASNPMALADPSQALLDQIAIAGDAVEQMIQDRIASGDLTAANPVTVRSSSATTVGLSSEPVNISPIEQYGYEVLPQETSDGRLNGNMILINDTTLPSSLEVVDKETGKILRPHIDDYVSDLIGPQGGRFYRAGRTRVNQPQGRDAYFNLVTPGQNGFSANRGFDARQKLRLRAGLEATASVVGNVLGLSMTDGRLKTVISSTLQFGPTVIDSLAGAAGNGSWGQFAEIWVNALLQDIESGGNASSVLWEQLGFGSEDVFKLVVKNANLAAKAAAIAEAAVDFVNRMYDSAATPGAFTFDIEWTLTLDNVLPETISSGDKSPQLTLLGTGFAPYETGIFGFFGGLAEPEVEITDPDAGSITLPGAVFNASNVMTTTVPATWLENAIGPLSVRVLHRNIYSNTVEVGLSEGLSITKIDPSPAAVGDLVTIFGTGFSTNRMDLTVKFSGDVGQYLPAKIFSSQSNKLRVQVPEGTASGPIIVEQGDQSTEAQFGLETADFSVSFGDDGNDLDDTYALYFNGELIAAMGTPQRNMGPYSLTLDPTRSSNTVTLLGLDAPDDTGTYFIEFTDTVEATGPSLSGGNLTKDVRLSWDITAVAGAILTSQSKERLAEKTKDALMYRRSE